MRIMTLNRMLKELRYEARLSPAASHGVQLQERHTALLRRIQEEIYDLYDWPMLETVGTIEIDPGQRHQIYPELIDMTGIQKTWVRMENDEDWHELTYGIHAEQMNQYDSDADEQEERVTRWMHFLASGAEVINTNMFEVWPIPTQKATVRFAGKRKLMPLADPNKDYSTLDGMCIVLHAAGELLAAQKSEDAQLKLQTAAARVERMKQAQVAPDNRRASMYPSGPSNTRTTSFRYTT